LKTLSEEARAVLDQLSADLLREGIHSHSEIRQGAVAQMLLDVARQYGAGLIVVGTKGNQGVGPVIVGAIAEELVRLAECPVLAVAADWNAGPFRPAPGGPVLLAMERNEAAGAAVATACSLARTFQRPLLALHARTAAEAAAAVNPCAATLEELGLEEFGIQADGEIEVRCIAKDGNPAEAIAEGIAENHPCILVAGVKRASETPGPHGTAFALLAVSRVPVLCVPPESVPAKRKPEACACAEAR
jgi:nucleotide-binding universal stress UspA family protein